MDPMSTRELVVLGTASQIPTRTRAHNGYVLRAGGETILFDPGEGTQRHMTLAGISATSLTRIAITHLHGDHALGLPGVVQRLSLDDVPHTVALTYPASGDQHITHLIDATVYAGRQRLARQPLTAPGPITRIHDERSTATLTAIRLDHAIETYGYRWTEPDTRTMDPARLARAGITGPEIGALHRDGHLTTPTGHHTLEEFSTPKKGTTVGFCMDTRTCDGAYQIADHADLLVIEATFLHRDRDLAHHAGHLTARQAAQIATESGVHTLVLTHFSSRYTDPRQIHDEARDAFTGTLHIAADLDRIPLPPRGTHTPGGADPLAPPPPTLMG